MVTASEAKFDRFIATSFCHTSVYGYSRAVLRLYSVEKINLPAVGRAADAGDEIRDVGIAAGPAHDHALEVLVAAGADESEVGAFDRLHGGRSYCIVSLASPTLEVQVGREPIADHVGFLEEPLVGLAEARGGFGRDFVVVWVVRNRIFGVLHDGP
jgi:hypothetical protein